MLEHRQHHIRLRRVGVEAAVVGIGLVVGLQQDVGILFLGHLQVGAALRQAHHEGLHARRRRRGMRVGMDRDEQVGFVAVGDAGALRQRDVHVGGARVDHLHVAVVVADQFAELFRNRQGDVFFLRPHPVRTRLGAAVTRVNHHRAHTIDLFFLRKSGTYSYCQHNNNGK